MRRSEREITDKNTLEAILNEAQTCRLALTDGRTPYIVPMSYAYENDCLYFHSAQEGKKIDMLRGNNRVCFEVDTAGEIIKGKNACGWSIMFNSVIGFGTAEFVNDEDGKRKALDLIMKKYSGEDKEFEYSKKALAEVLVIKVSVESMAGKKTK